MAKYQSRHYGGEIDDAVDKVKGLDTALAKKVDKVAGKSLSTNDYTNAEKEKLALLKNYNDEDVRKEIKTNSDAIKNLKTAGEKKIGAQIVLEGFLYSFKDEADKAEYMETLNADLILGTPIKLPEGGGGGGTTDILTLSVNSNKYYTRGTQTIDLQLKVRNIYEEDTDRAVDVSVTKDGRSLYSAVAQKAGEDGYIHVALNGSDFRNVQNVTEQIVVTVNDYEDDTRKASRTVNVSCVLLNIALQEGYNFGQVNRSSIVYIPTFIALNNNVVKLICKVYNASGTLVSEPTSTQTPISNNPYTVNLNWDGLNTGAYTVKAWLDMGNGLVQSDEVTTELICIKRGDESLANVIAVNPVGSVTLYDDKQFDIAVYHEGKDEATVRLSLNGKVSTLLMRTGQVNRDYVQNIDKTSNELRVSIMDGATVKVTKLVTFNAEGSFTWSTIEGAVIDLIAKGRSNSEVNPSSWGDADIEFRNVEFAEGGSGWTGDSLHLTTKGEMVLKHTPLYDTTVYDADRQRGGGILALGRTIRTRFKVGNIANTENAVISCWDGDMGYYITPDSIYVNVGGEITTAKAEPQATKNDRHFNAGTENELVVTVQPTWDAEKNRTQKIVTMYVNGQFAGEVILKVDTLTQKTATPITFKADGCELDIYRISIYNKCLNSFEVLQNYVMGVNSLEDMKAAFEKEQCYTGNGIVSYNEAFDYCKRLSAQMGEAVDGTCALVVNTYEFAPSEIKTDVFPDSEQELSLIFFKNGEVDTERSIKYRGEARTGDNPNLRVRIQGTSTAMEFRKNMRYDSKGTVKKYKWSKDAYEAGGSQNPDDGWVENGTATKLNIFITGNSTTENGCSTLTTKTNYNESTSTRNLPMAKWTEDAIKILGNYKIGDELAFPTLLTPPQKKDAKIRQAINGLPAIQFTHDLNDGSYRFTGKVDLITDKKNSSIFGFSKSDARDYSIEFRDGDSDVCCFRVPSLKKACQYTDTTQSNEGDDHLEYRWSNKTDDEKSAWGDAYIRNDSALQRLFDFVFNCHPDFIGYKSKNGVISKTEGDITIRGVSYLGMDNKEYRIRKYKEERGNYIGSDSFDFNGLVSKVFLWADQRAKNQFYTHYVGDEIVSEYTDEMNEKGMTYEVLRLLPYDIDTSLRGDNASRLRYDFTRLYNDSDVYTDVATKLSIAQEHYAEQGAIDDASAFIRDRVSNKKSALWELEDMACSDIYAKMYAILTERGMLSLETLKRYCITNEADAYNNTIYNADTQYKYVASGSDEDQTKAHGSAREDLMWWLEGRMYFMGGEHGSGDWSGKNVINGNLAVTSTLDEDNQAMRSFTIQAKSNVRNYVGVKAGSGGNIVKQYAPNTDEAVSVTFPFDVIAGEDSARFQIFGGKQVNEFVDMSKLYIASIQSWGGCTNMRTMIFGSSKEEFNNSQLSNIKGSDNPVFGACEILDLRGCTKYDDGDMRCFPAAKTMLLERTAIKALSLPVTNEIEVLHLPQSIETFSFTNKSKIKELKFEGCKNLYSVTADNSNDKVMSSVLDALYNYYNQ